MSDYYQTTRDILHGIEQVHWRLSQHYDQLGENHAQPERLRMLLDYMSQHEKRLEVALQRTTKDASIDVLETWFRDAPALDELVKKLAPVPTDSPQQLVQQAQALNYNLVQVYEQMAANAPTDQVQRLFENLAQQERQEQTRLQMSALRLEDI